MPSEATAPQPKTLRDLKGIGVDRLKGAGPKLVERLTSMGIGSVLDLLEHYPRRYLDRRTRAEIADLVPGDEATVFAEVVRIAGRRTRNGRALVEAVVSDGSSRMNVTFFNQAWRERQLPVGTEAAFFGKLEVYRGGRQMTNPVVDVFGAAGEPKTAGIVPIYPQSAKADVSTWQLRTLVTEALRRVPEFADPLPAAVRAEQKLIGRGDAYRSIHQPTETADQFTAQRRLKFDEFLRMQVGLVARKRALEADARGIAHAVDGALVAQFVASLPYSLTGDQQRVLAEIAADLARPAPMHRLLQGDVGSGKTVVALATLLTAVEGGYQGALMAPTEVLAEQHYLGSARLLDGLTVTTEGGGGLFPDRPVRAALLTNRTPAAQRRRLAAELEAGEIDIVIGTHALLYGEWPWKALGAVVIDEQHRFGVEQRALLTGGGPGGVRPDVLVMTATPIPRTAGMLIYGDLDKSELREMPPGRTPITTEHVVDPAPAYERLREQVGLGRQAYVVCPLVEGSERVEAKSATEEYERLQAEELAGLAVGLLHGQMKAAEKEAVMGAFRAGELDALVATTVIEVGVDVPNATVMVVEDADRFGLSQLHQLRGRVGRGGGDSWCFLVAEPTTPDGEARLEAMVESTDGFLLAERDLEIRGAGEVFGARQSGLGDLKLGRIPRDEAIVLEARAVAERILDDDAQLARHRQLADEVEDLLGDAVEFLFKS